MINKIQNHYNKKIIFKKPRIWNIIKLVIKYRKMNQEKLPKDSTEKNMRDEIISIIFNYMQKNTKNKNFKK